MVGKSLGKSSDTTTKCICISDLRIRMISEFINATVRRTRPCRTYSQKTILKIPATNLDMIAVYTTVVVIA